MILKQHYFKQNVLSILALSVHSFGTVFLTVIYLQFQQLMISKEKKNSKFCNFGEFTFEL